MRFDNELLERISDNRDKHSCCESLCFSPPPCLQRINMSCKEACSALPSLSVRTCTLYIHSTIQGKVVFLHPLFRDSQGTSEQRSFQCSQLLNMLLIYLTFFLYQQDEKRHKYSYLKWGEMERDLLCILKIKNLWLKRV